MLEYIPQNLQSLLMGLAMERAIVFFFENFVYTFGGQIYLQIGGGPIGARLTMAVARLIMQDWKDIYDQILKNRT